MQDRERVRSDGRRRVSAVGAWTRRMAVAVACAAMVGVVAGCGSSGDAKKEAGQGGTLTIAIGVKPPTLDPALGQNQNAAFVELAYDPLIVAAPDGSFKPGLATAWKYGPRNESFSITLRSGVTFSDGEKLDAQAVKTWINHAIALPGSLATTYFSSLKSIDVTGPLTLTLRFGAPTPLLERVFSQVLEMGMIGSPKAVRAKTLTNATAGAGPYALDRSGTVIGDHYTYRPNPRYWNKGAIRWKRVVVKVVTNPNAALQALKTGQVDVAVAQPTTNVKAADQAGLKYVNPLTLYMALALLDRDGKVAKPLGDVRVRQALNYGIDRAAVANVIGAGHGRPTAQMAVPGDDSFDASLDKRYPYDPEKARQLLAAAGYPKGFSLRTLSTTIVAMDQFGQAVSGQLAKVGVKLDLDVKPDTGDYTSNLGSAKFPAATIAFGRLPAATNYQLLWGPKAGLFNPFKSADPTLAALNDRLVAAPTEQAPAIARQIQARLVDQAWFVPVVSTPLVTMYRSTVTGVNASPRRNVPYMNEIRPAT
jgi:peptide/nickel transport system substrate-binding protein